MKKNFDKEDYKSLKESFPELYVYAKKIEDQDWATIYNGVSVAFKPVSARPDCRMLYVAVSYCAPEDEFRKKTGKYQALLKFSCGEFIQVPLAHYLADCGPDDTASVLLDMFGSV